MRGRASRALCEQIRLYAELQRKWFIGPIRCKSVGTRVCGQEFISMCVYGHYWDLNGVKKTCFLHFDLEGGIVQCGIAKDGLWFQMNPNQILRMFGLLDKA